MFYLATVLVVVIGNTVVLFLILVNHEKRIKKLEDKINV